MSKQSKTKSLGGLWRATKTKERSPDLVGKVKIQRELLETLCRQIDQSGASEVEASLAGWINNHNADRYVSVELSPKYVPQTKNQQVQQGRFDAWLDKIE